MLNLCRKTYALLAVLCLLTAAAAAQTRAPAPLRLEYQESTGKYDLANVPALQKKGKARKSPFWGIYFWEFGDGHYWIFTRKDSLEKVIYPTYRPAKASALSRVYLTPFYSPDPPKFAEKATNTGGKGPATPMKYDLDRKLVMVETNTGGRVLPGQPIRTVVSYQAPVHGDGYLLVLFNRKDEGISTGFERLKLEPGSASRYYQETLLSGLPEGALKGEALSKFQRLRNMEQYQSLQSYRVTGMRKGDINHFFLTLLSDKRLENYRDKNLSLQLCALWIPDNVPFNERTMSTVYQFDIQSVHDPNRIRVSPRTAYFRRNYPKRLQFKVDFLNKGDGEVEDVAVHVPMDAGFDIQTLQVEATDPKCRACPQENFRDSVCYRLQRFDQPTGKDSVVITFHNIGLGAKGGIFESKKHRKGSVTYSIKSNNQRSGRTTAQAKIAFLGAAPIVTGRTATQWRQKSLYAKPGFTFGLNRDAIPETDSLAAGNWHNRLSLAIGYQNAPIGTGLVYGLELATTRHRFYQDTTTLVAPDGGFLPNGGYLFQSQSFDIRYLELKAIGGWQFEGLVRGSAGLGIAVPAFARLSGRAMASFEPTFKDPVYTTRSSKQYGLFQDRNDPVFLFNQPLENKPSPGLSWHFAVEAGLMNEVSLGLEWQTRFFPNFYRGGCATFSNFNATLRFKFGVLGGKH